MSTSSTATTSSTTTTSAPPVPSAVQARALSLDGPRGPVFGPLDLAVPAGALFLVTGPAGSGRTSLLLTLAGRMSGTTGELLVDGLALPRRRRAVQHAVSLATLHGVNDLDGALTVEEHVLERLALASPWWRLLTPSGSDVAPVLAAVHQGDRPDLDRRALVRDLDPYDAFRLGVALALVAHRHRRPHALVVDDVDALRDPVAVGDAWRLLFGLAGSPDGDAAPPLTVIASCTSATTLPDDLAAHPRTHTLDLRPEATR